MAYLAFYALTVPLTVYGHYFLLEVDEYKPGAKSTEPDKNHPRARSISVMSRSINSRSIGNTGKPDVC